jgi:guanylate kinase
MTQQLIAITGPSCGGKTTLKNNLLELSGGNIVEIVTTTTRMPRDGERTDAAYRFCSVAEFEQLKDDGAFIEWVHYDGHYYGISHESLAGFHDSGKSGVIVATTEGVSVLTEWCADNGVTIMRVLATAPVDELLRRLSSRKDRNRQVMLARRRQILAEARRPTDFSRYDWVVDPALGTSLTELVTAKNA